MSPSITERLADLKVFESLEHQDLQSIAALFSLISFSRDQSILSHGELTSSVYFLTAGKVRATLYSPAGRAVSYQELLPGEMFGELSAIDHLPRSTHVIGLSEGECLVITGSDFFAIMSRYPAITQAVLLKMAGLVRFLCDRLYEFATLSVAERLRAELLRLARQTEHEDNQPVVIDMPTHEELANRLATHREAITRELGYLEKHGIVSKQRNKVTILDWEALGNV